MNDYMEQYIKSTINYLKTFEASLKMAALKNDGKIDKQEQKILSKATKLTDKYIDDLDNLID